MLKKFKIPKQILYLLVLAIFLNILRIVLFKSFSFSYMIWNIVLAFVPFLISSILFVYTTKENMIKPFFIIGFILWFLFLPNAPYVITDFIHLGRVHTAPVMYDTFLLFTSALASLFMGLYSLCHIEKILLLRFSKKVTNIVVAFTILFASFGIYLGRYLHFNSWDLFISQNSLFVSIWKIFTQSNDYVNVYWYTLLFFIFIYTAYLSFRE